MLVVTTVSDLVAQFPNGGCVSPKPCSWITSGADLEAGVPYPLWDDPRNSVHGFLWRHLRLGIELVDVACRVAQTADARRTVNDRLVVAEDLGRRIRERLVAA